MRLNLSDSRVYEPQIQPRFGTRAQFCEVVVPVARDLNERLGGREWEVDEWAVVHLDHLDLVPVSGR